MKIQNLAVIFIIIILPITLILTSYIQSQVQTLNLQTSYDTKLNNATYDALKAFQLNTINSDTSDIANSKLRDIEASVNTFFNSISSNFNMAGYNEDILKEYVPALVYTMYDGYYIYSPFTNTLTDKEQVDGATYTNGEKISGLKPYVHYSCRYKKESGDDFVITYSLDNYITIQGKIDGKNVYAYGYLLNNITEPNGKISYRGIDIADSESLQEFIDSSGEKYEYIKINGEKYYKNTKDASSWFSLLNGEQYKQDKKFSNNISGQLYYKEAKEFTNRVLNTYNLSDLKASDAVDEKGEKITDENGNLKFGDYYIFRNPNNISIEDPNSNFNQHRLEIIRYSIEKNLSIAIANYNNYSGGSGASFQMPKLKEDEWDKIINNVSIISFLQGLNIGGKIYNGYSIITNTKNQEVVSDDSIYIVSNGQYYKPTDKELLKLNNFTGVFNIDFETKTKVDSNGNTTYFLPHTETGSYSSIVNHTDVEDTYNIYDYIQNCGNENLARAYFTALGRERYSMYKTNNNSEELKNKFVQ